MTLQELGKEIELQRFLMEMGRLEFVKYLEINYNTYKYFIDGTKQTSPRIMKILKKFAESKGIDVSGLALIK